MLWDREPRVDNHELPTLLKIRDLLLRWGRHEEARSVRRSIARRLSRPDVRLPPETIAR